MSVLSPTAIAVVIVFGGVTLALLLAMLGAKATEPTLTPPPRLKGVTLKLRIYKYVEPSYLVSPIFWGHRILCEACNHAFVAGDMTPIGSVRCPQCFTQERAALVVEEWQNRVIHKQFPPVEKAP